MVGVTFVGATVLLVPKTKAVKEALHENIIAFRTSMGKRESAEFNDGQEAGSKGGPGDGARGGMGGTGDGPRHQAMDLDNNPIKCLAAASAVERYQGLAVVGRLMSAEKRKLVCPEWLLPLPKLAQMLEQYRSSRPGGIGGGDFSSFQGVKDLDKMGVMVKGVTKDSPFETALRSLNNNAHNWTKISVLQFLDSESTKSISFEKGECGWLGRQLIERSVLYHGQFGAVLCSEELGQATDALRQSLVKDTHVWERFDDVQILFLVCKMLANWYFELSFLQESITFAGAKMDTPLKCAKLLELGCNDLVSSATKLDATKGWGGKAYGGEENVKEGGAAQRPGAGKGQGPGKGPSSRKKETTDVSKEDALEAASFLYGEVSKLLQAAIINSRVLGEGDGGLGSEEVQLPLDAGGYLLAPPQWGKAKGLITGTGLPPGGVQLPLGAGPTGRLRLCVGQRGDAFSGCAGGSEPPPFLDPGPAGIEGEGEEGEGPTIPDDFAECLQWSEWKATQEGDEGTHFWPVTPTFGECLDFENGRDKVFERAVRAFERASHDYLVDAAVEAAGDFRFDEAMLAKDLADFEECGRDIDELVRRRKATLALDRISAKRVAAPTGPSEADWPGLQSKYRAAAPAVNMLLETKFVKKGIVLILPRAATAAIEGLNVHPSGWALKNNFPLGRNTGNPMSMNTKFTKEHSDLLWGIIHHSTIDVIVQMILCLYHRLIKEGMEVDLKGAYTLLFYLTVDAQLFATELTELKLLVYMSGFFGWTGTPAAFHVVTLGLQWEMNKLLNGDCVIYVDDIIVATLLC
ncbi:hypothetical protein B484DRAFT_403828 [Ochromonadaceae sp. CCMP2298]|nr:hypothetical protein B484DRAFT_403828 [Ochromonadaceae sp. CCMP2298]